MVLVTHHTPSSYVAVPLRTLSWKKGIKLKHNGLGVHIKSRTDGCTSLKHAFPLRSDPQFVRGVKGRPLQISSFKGNVQNDNSGDASNKSTFPQKSVKVSIVRQDRDETLSECSAAHDLPVSCASESDKTISGSQTIRSLFTKWLNLLHSGAPGELGNDMLEESPQIDRAQEQKAVNTKNRGEVLKVVLCYFLGLDAAITIPLMIFIPVYLAVNVVYGAEVSRELTPLWIIGPLIVALYVKLVRGIIALYVFSFKQTVKVVRNLPTYHSIAYKYIVEGKLKEEFHARFIQPVIDIKNADYKELSIRKWKAFQEWMLEKYLDFVESIWPYYCRTIRFLKRANLI